jgi:predicted AAA+ superfamily ATPase
MEQIIQGFYPQFQVEPNLNWDLWFSSYVSTYLERDVRNIKAIPDLSRFQAFLSSLATRAGQLLNMAEIAKECSISEPIVRDWLSILESTYIIFLLRPYHSRRTTRFIKSPKVFFVDTGLLCYLLGIDNSNRFLRSGEKGHIFENMVIAEFIKKASHQTERSGFFFYRTASGVEIDLLVEKKDALFAYEIKFSKTIRSEMTRPMLTFLKEEVVKEASLLSLYEETTPLTQGITAQHWSKPILG